MADDAISAEAARRFTQEKQDQVTLDATASMQQAITKNPDEMARYNSIARKVGYDPLMISNDPEVRFEVENKLKIQEANLPSLASTHPFTANLLTDPVKASLTHDDIGGLQHVEDAWSQLWRSTGAGALSLAATGVDLLSSAGSALGVVTSADEAAVLYKNDPEGLRRFREESVAGGLDRFARELQRRSTAGMEQMPESAKKRYGGLEYATTDTSKAAYLSPVKMVGDALRSLPTSVALAATALLTRGASARAAAAAEASAVELGLEGAAKKEFIKNASQAAAERAATISGAVGEGAVGYSMQKLQTEEELVKKDLSNAPRYQELIAQGFSPEAAKAKTIAETSQQAGAMAGLVDAAVNAAAGKLVADMFTAKRRVFPAAGIGAAVEGGTEFVQSVGEQLGANLAEQRNINPNADITKGTLEAGLQGLFIGGLTGGVAGGTAAYLDRVGETEQNAAQAEQKHQALSQLSQAAAGAKLRERDPVAFKQFVQEMVADADLKEVFIDGTKLQEVLNQAPVEVQQRFAQEMPNVVDQLAEAGATDGLVRVPIEDYATHIAGTEIDAAVLPNLRTEEEGLTYAQAVEERKSVQEQMTQEADRILEENAADAEYQADSKKVHDEILKRIEGAQRFSSDVNQKYAALAHARYVVAAKKEGVTPSEMFARFPLRVQAERAPGAELEQAVANPFINTGDPHDKERSDGFNAARGGKTLADNPYSPAVQRGQGQGRLGVKTMRTMQAREQRWAEGFEAAGKAPLSQGARPSSAYGYRARDAARKATLESFAPERVQDLLRQTDWAILTAENPNAEALTAEENAARMAELKADLEKMGVQYVDVKGKYGNEENSVAIVGVTREQALELGQKYGQQSVLTRDGLVYPDGTVNPARGVTAHKELPGDFYSVVPNTGAAFSVDIDFDRRLPLGENRIGEVQIEAVHFSQQKRTVLQGAKYGTGARGAEARRLSDPNAHPSIKQRISFYVDEGKGVRPEQGVGSVRHELTLTNMYDGARNPLRLPSEANAFEAAVVNAGFDGYYIAGGFGEQGAAVLLGEAAKDVEVDTPPVTGEYAQAMNEVVDNDAPSGKLTPQDTADLRKLWSMYASADSAAKYGMSTAKAASLSQADIVANMKQIADDVFAGAHAVAPVVRDITRFREGMHSQVPYGAMAFEFSDGKRTAEAYFDPKDKSLQLNILNWGEGGHGSAIYKILLDFARNNGVVFYGDVQGISVAGSKRRLENLLSHAIQTGDTSYMRLHPKQISFIEQETGVAIKWDESNSQKNVEQMLNASYNLANLDIPELKNVYFDFNQKQYIDTRSGGAAADLAGYIAKARRNPDAVRREGAPGMASARRTVLSNTLLRAKTPEARRAVFAGMAELVLDELPGAERLLYQSAPEGKPAFYSALTKAFEETKLAKAAPDQWLGTLNSLTQKGVKPMEIEYTGLKEWIEARKMKADSWHTIDENGAVISSKPATDPKPDAPMGGEVRLYQPSRVITKEEIIDFLTENAVTVEPRVYGGEGAQVAEFDFSFGQWETEEPDIDWLAESARERIGYLTAGEVENMTSLEPDDAEAFVQKMEGAPAPGGRGWQEWLAAQDSLFQGFYREVEQAAYAREENWYWQDSDSPTFRSVSLTVGGDTYEFSHYSSYGDNYLREDSTGKEVTIAGRRVDDAVIESSIRNYIAEEYGVYEGDGEDATKFESYKLSGGDNYRERLLLNKSHKGEAFTYTNHFDDENIIGHSRVDDREVPLSTIEADFPELAARLKAEGRNRAKVYFIEEVQSDWAQQGRERPEVTVPAERVEDLVLNEEATAASGEETLPLVKVGRLTDSSGYVHTKDKGLVSDQTEFWHLYQEGDVAAYPGHTYTTREAAEQGRLRMAGAMWIIEGANNTYQIPRANYPTVEDAKKYIVTTKTKTIPGEKTAFDTAREVEALEREKEVVRREMRTAAGDTTPEGEAKYDELSAKYKALSDKVIEMPRDSVAPGAFVESTDAWVGLVLKDAIHQAAAGGFDLVAWTTGDQQTHRWSRGLRKQVDEIRWEKSEDGKIHIIAAKGGREMANTRYGENDLSAAIGKTMAKQIIENPDQKGTIQGEQITVADLGMTKFYGDAHGLNPDGKPAIVTKVANQVLKKLGGGQVKGAQLHPDYRSLTNKAAVKQDQVFSGQPTFEITPQVREMAMQGQPLFQKNRGTFNPDTLTISLLKDADLTTFLHELGHFFLEMDASLASAPTASQQQREDFQKVMNWFGIKDVAVWNTLPLEQKRPYHEKYARGFEAYLFEGRAPSAELKSVFDTFKTWLKHVYQTLRNLNVELTDEVRGVFDRMLATDEAIAQAEARRSMKAAMIEAMTPEEKAAYLALDSDASDEAADELQRRSLRDMQWLGNARSKVLKDLQRQQASKRKQVRAEVTAEVMAEPINQARTFLRKGEMVDSATGDLVKADKGFRLDTAALAEMYPETMLARPDLTALRGMTMKGGLHPDLVADMFGFPSGDALVRELVNGEDPKAKIEGGTDQRMLERHGDLYDDAALQRAADEAIHNEARARFMATGLKALSKSKLPVAQITKAATDAAEETIAAKKVRDIKPKQYEAAESKANKDVLKHAAKDTEKAKRAQRSALLNNRLAKAAHDALEEVRKGVDRMNRTQKAAAQANMRGEYLVQLNALLDRFDLRKSTTLKEIDAQRTPLAEWLAAESERMSAVVPDLPAWVLNEGYRISYKDLTLEEFRGLADTVKQLEMLARREDKQYKEIRGMKFAEERSALLQRIREFHPEAFSLDGEPLGMSPKFVKNLGDTVSELGDKFAGEFLNAETIVNLLEGGEFGLVHESLLGRMSKGADWKASKLGSIYQQMAPYFGQYTVKERYDFSRKDIGAPIGMSLTRENALVVALLHGNKEGRERLANYGWPEAKQEAIIDLLDERDMKLAQSIWDLFDNVLWPELKELNDRTRGKSPPKVEAVPVYHKGKEYRGGYFRLKYDTNLDERAQRLDEGQAVKELLGGGMGMSAKTGQGASTERKQNVTMRPRLDLGVFAEAVTETVHDLAYREAVADTMRMLNDSRVQNTIKTAAGVPAYRALVTRVREIAAPPRNPSGFIEKTLTVARKNTIVTLMSGVNTALQNFTGFVSASARVNPGRLAKEIALFYSPQMADRYNFAIEQSEYMRNRHNSFERDLQNEIKKLTVNANILPDTGAMLALMSIVDKGTSVPVWNAAFAEGMKKFENDKAKAIDYADHTVRQSQGSGRELDVAQIMSGHGGYGQLKKVFTMFYSYFNAQLGMLVRSGAVNKRLAKTNPAMAAARFTKDFMLVFVLPAVLTKMIFKGGDDGEDPEEWMHNYGHALAMYGLAMIPLVRDIGSFAWASFDHDVRNYGFKVTPIQSAGEGIVKGAVAAKDIAEGEGDDKDLKNLIMGTSYAVGLPGKLISDTTLGAAAWAEGEAGPEAVLVGPPKK